MMSTLKRTITALAGCVVLLLMGVTEGPGLNQARAEGEGTFRIGYLYLDEEGNRSVDRDVFNIYEGPVLSLEDFHYITDGGLLLSAALKNISLNSRDLEASLSQSGQFGLALYNNQYRRIYSFEGDKDTRRRTTGGQGHYYLRKHFKLFGGFSRTDRQGQSQYIAPPYGDAIPFSHDYSHTSFNVGGQAFYRKGNLRLEYRRSDFSDNNESGNDREAGVFKVDAFSPLPWYERLFVSAGYQYRRDLHNTSAIELITNQGWLGTRLRLAHEMTVEYRFMAARTDHSRRPIEIDNYVNTVNAGRDWPGRGGFRVGYENRICDDILNRTVSNGLLLSGWFRYQERLTLRGRFSVRKKEVREGATLVGDEDYSRHRLYAGYRLPPWGDISLEYQHRVRTDDDIDTRTDYEAFTAALNLGKNEYGRLDLTYSYYQGTYENRASDAWRRYEFGDHVLIGNITLAEYRRVRLSFGATYFRSHRDSDLEKIGMQTGMIYSIQRGYKLEMNYQALNQDNFLSPDEYYTGNIVEISLIKDFTF